MQPIARNGLMDYLKTVLLHLLMVVFYSLVYQGMFLLTYPPAALFWLLLSMLLASMHRAAHTRILKSFFGDWFLVQIWVQPLLFMGILISVILMIFGIAEGNGEADIFRRGLQLPIDLFTNMLYILLLMVFSSGTYLFVEAVWCWVPVLQSRHLGRRSRMVSRLTLLILTFFALLGIWFVVFQRSTHVGFLQGMLLEGLDRPREALQYYAQVKDSPERLIQSAKFRMGRIEMLRLRDYRKALGHFSEIVLMQDSPLREEALLQSLYCIYSMEGSSSSLLPYVQELYRLDSHLYDEAAFLLVQKLVAEQKYDEAMAQLEVLQNLSPVRFTIQSWLNSDYRSYEITPRRAAREQQNLKALL